MTIKCTNKTAVLADIEKVLPYDFKSRSAEIQVLEASAKNAIYLFLEYKNYWHSYYIQSDGSLSQARGGNTPNDSGLPPIQNRIFTPDAVARALQVIHAKCNGNGK